MGLDTKVKRYRQAYPFCQWTSPHLAVPRTFVARSKYPSVCEWSTLWRQLRGNLWFQAEVVGVRTRERVACLWETNLMVIMVFLTGLCWIIHSIYPHSKLALVRKRGIQHSWYGKHRFPRACLIFNFLMNKEVNGVTPMCPLARKVKVFQRIVPLCKEVRMSF